MTENVLLLLQSGDSNCVIALLKWIFELSDHWPLFDGAPLLHSIGAFTLEIFFPVIDLCIGSCIRKWNLHVINWIFICSHMTSIKWKYSDQYLYCPWLFSLLISMNLLRVEGCVCLGLCQEEELCIKPLLHKIFTWKGSL